MAVRESYSAESVDKFFNMTKEAVQAAGALNDAAVRALVRGAEAAVLKVPEPEIPFAEEVRDLARCLASAVKH